VKAARGDTLVFGGWSVDDPQEDGLYDLENDKYLIEPKAGQMLNYKRGGAMMCYQYDTPDATGDETSQWIYIFADGRTVDFPLALGRMQDYYPETGWFGGMWSEKPGRAWITGAYEQRIYDKDLKVIPALSGWSIDSVGFNGGQWCMIYNNRAFPGVSTWVNRQGKLSDKRFNRDIYSGYGWRCYFSGENFNWALKTGVLFDADLNEACRTGPGERLAVLRTLEIDIDECFALLDVDNNIKAVYDLAAKPMQAPAQFRCWLDSDANTLYRAQQGQWHTLELNQFLPKAGHRDREPFVRALAASQDYVVVETGVHWWEAGESYGLFAVDWDGKPMDNCPLEPFFEAKNNRIAGEQGPFYCWVEVDGRRGFINTKGEWLFVDEG